MFTFKFNFIKFLIRIAIINSINRKIINRTHTSDRHSN